MEEKDEANIEKTITYIGFNQEANCFSVGTNTGFRIYNSETCKMNFERSNKKFNINIFIKI